MIIFKNVFQYKCCFFLLLLLYVVFFSQYSSLMMSCLAAMLFRFGYARREVKVKRQRYVYTPFLFDFRFGLNVFEHRHLRTHTKSTFDHCVQEWRIFSRLIGFIKKLNNKKKKKYIGVIKESTCFPWHTQQFRVCLLIIFFFRHGAQIAL